MTELANGSFILSAEEKDKMVETQAHEQGTLVAQIFSGIFFSGVAAWLTVSNGTKLAFVQKAALEKRLTVCCFFNVYVGFFSAFFNFFQLTTVDDLPLPGAGDGFTLDLARPIEWIMTCPLMQLSLVIMGGAKLPEYRRQLMPAFSAVILCLGTAGAFFGDKIFAIKAVCFFAGVFLFCTMVYFNRMQIIEYSNGQEGILSGDSEFRKATVLLITTWAPFPCWYIVSPEGLGLISNVLIIQLGWAFLNIVSKFSFIFYIQRCKDMYCNRLKTKRELQPDHKRHGAGAGHRHGSVSPPGEMDFSGGAVGGMMSREEYEQQDKDRKKAQLSAVVVETMTFLGMAQHTERFLTLLERSRMESIYDVEALDPDSCAQLQLPFELVSACQRRLKVWKLEMVDDAEAGLDKGEEFWIKRGVDVPQDMEGAPPAGAAYMMPGVIPFEQTEEQNARLADIEDLLRKKMETEDAARDALIHESRSKTDLFDKSVEGLAMKFQSAMEAMEQRILARVDAASNRPVAMERSASQNNDIAVPAAPAAQRSEVRAFETRITAKLDELQTVSEQQRRHELHTLESRISASVEQQIAIVLSKMDVVAQKAEACGHKADACAQKVESSSAELMAKTSDSAAKLSEKLDEVGRVSRKDVDALKATVEACVAQLSTRCQSIAETTGPLSAQIKEGVDLLVHKADAVAAAQAKMLAASEDGWRSRLTDLEANMVCREDEIEAKGKRRHDEILRLSPLRKVEELVAQVAKLGERSDQAFDAMQASLTSEVQGAASRLTTKTESLQSAVARQLAEGDAAAQRRAEEAAGQAQQAAGVLASRLDAVDSAVQKRGEASEQAVQQIAKDIDTAVKKALESLSASGQQTTDRAFGKTAAAVEELGATLPKRLEDAIAKVAEDAAQSGANAAERRAEKAVEALTSTHRSDVHAAATSILEGIGDNAAAQARKSTEREDRNMRRLEELLEISTNRTMQKTEDVGVDMKKELHGFAKRLNSKIPFM